MIADLINLSKHALDWDVTWILKLGQFFFSESISISVGNKDNFLGSALGIDSILLPNLLAPTFLSE